MLGRTLAKFNYIYNNRVFERMSYKDLATPQLIKKMMQIPVKGLTKKAKYNFYQGVSHKTKIQTCFSEVKTNVLVKPNVFYKPLHSKVLGCRIKAHVSSTAYRTIRKYGGFDNYITCMDPKKFKSPYAEYIQTLMLRKIENPDLLVPYVLKSKQLKKVKARQYIFRKRPRIIEPPNPDPYYNPRPFGENVEEMDDQQYAKQKLLQQLSQKYEDLDTTHPLVRQLELKLEGMRNYQIQEKAKKAEEVYLNIKRDKKIRKKLHLETLQQIQEYTQRMRQQISKKQGLVKDQDLDEDEENQRFQEYQEKLQKLKQQAIQKDMRESNKMVNKMVTKKQKRLQEKEKNKKQQ